MPFGKEKTSKAEIKITVLQRDGRIICGAESEKDVRANVF